MEELYWTHSWDNVTTIHPIALVIIVTLSLAIIFIRRQYVLIPIFLGACFIAPAQRIVIASLDFSSLRILGLVGWIRVILKKETTGFKWNPLDKIIIILAFSRILTYFALWQTTSALIYKLGESYSSVGTYFLLRILIKKVKDIEIAIKGFILISILVAIAFLLEKATARNIFSVFGGVPEITRLRGGRLRCQGAFPHPIIAGCFWAALLPMFMAQLWQKKGKVFGLLGIITSSIIIITTASSTPMMGLMVGLIGFCFYPIRYKVRLIFVGIIFLFLGLSFYMNAPVWAIFARIDIVGGSTGYHRYRLIDSTIRNFKEWWLIGIKSTGHWGFLMYDITNQYVKQAVSGGLITLILFILLIRSVFKNWDKQIKESSFFKDKNILAWAIGLSMSVHLIQFIGVSYFGQISLIWNLSLVFSTISMKNVKNEILHNI